MLESAGGLFTDIFQNPEDKLKLALVVATAERTPNQETNGMIGLNFSSQLNERISINGKVGVPVGGINQSAIVGNLEILYRVNVDGTMNVRVFNRENDINYIGESIGYTQGIGLNYQVDFDTFKDLVNKVFKNQKLERAKNNAIQFPDSVIPDFINFEPSKKEKEEETPKPPIEGVPPKDD